MLHKLDLSPASSTPKADPVVDDEQLVANNQPARDFSKTSPKNQTTMKKNSLVMTVVISLIAIAAGVGTGYGSHKLFATGSSGDANIPSNMEQIPSGTVKEGDVFGSTDTETFKDPVQGYLEIGGLDGEGSHKLLRAGGPSQTVYMTSSVTDLDKFDGMEVKVWGETFTGQKAGWLMDVGRVEVVKVQGESPAQAEE